MAGFRWREALGYSTCEAPHKSLPLWIEEDKRVFYTIINEAEDDDGCFKFPQFTIPHLKKISLDIETNLMSDNTFDTNSSSPTWFYEGQKNIAKIIKLGAIMWKGMNVFRTGNIWMGRFFMLNVCIFVNSRCTSVPQISKVHTSPQYLW
jgi:hypothetical protein